VSGSASILSQLARFESPNVTFVDPAGGWPIVWDRARGSHVRDVDGREYLDLTAAFGVAAAGHANPRVVAAGQKQMARLLHAMGDVHPHPLKAQLAERLSALTFERWENSNSKTTRSTEAKTIFGNSGFESVEAALKTSLLATGKPGIVAFEGAYHGLGYGAMATTHRQHFRKPFQQQLRRFCKFLPFPRTAPELNTAAAVLEQTLKSRRVGAVLVEPIQGRGGIRIPPRAFLPLLRQLTDAYGALLIVDEIYTGFGRTGAWFACEHSGTVPDLICLGKALTGGFPLSACVGRGRLMDRAWPPATGEAIHTSTYLGHPVGCAMALAQIDVLRSTRAVQRAAKLGRALAQWLAAVPAPRGYRIETRALGLLAGLEVHDPRGGPATALVQRTIRSMLHRGFILLPEGPHGNVISFSPPLTIRETELKRAVTALSEALAVAAAHGPSARERSRPRPPRNPVT
jgi:4-aminobutyrate aminotransferase-like enzyme